VEVPNKVGILPYAFHFRTEMEPIPKTKVVLDKVEI
jgi:hypothetical protein